MKTFIYTTVSKKRSMGGQNVVATVYEIVKNEPFVVAEVKWNTSSYKGDKSCIMNHLAENGVIAAEFSEGYFHDNNKFRIFGL